MHFIRRSEAPNPKSYGQNGPKIQLNYEDLRWHELTVLRALYRASSPGYMSLETLAKGVLREFARSRHNKTTPMMTAEKANSEARNALRRLVRAGFAHRASPGRYCVTSAGKAIIMRGARGAGQPSPVKATTRTTKTEKAKAKTQLVEALMTLASAAMVYAIALDVGE